MLAPLLTATVNANKKTPRSTLAALLVPYVRQKLPNSYVQRIFKLIDKNLHGDVGSDVSKVPRVLAALRSKGWLSEYTTASKDEMKVILTDIAKTAHTQKEKLKPKE
jgi:hypothetical protein